MCYLDKHIVDLLKPSHGLDVERCSTTSALGAPRAGWRYATMFRRGSGVVGSGSVVKHAGMGAGLFSAAGLLALFGLGGVITAAIAALSLALPVWAAPLIVAGILFALAAGAGLVSKKQLDQASPSPEMTIADVKHDIDEVKDARHAR